MRLNVRRGFFRFWIVCSAIWILAVAFIGYKQFRSERDAWHAPVSEIMVPTDCSSARGIEGTDFDKRDGHCWYTLPVLRASYPEYRDMNDYDVAKRLYVKAGVGWKDNSAWKNVASTAGWALGIPAAVFVLGWAILWAFSGFRATPV